MKLNKTFLIVLTICACQTSKFDFGRATNYLPSKKLLKEGVVNKYYTHQKKHTSQDISTHIMYTTFQSENDKLLSKLFDPDYSLVRSSTYSFKDDKMILLKEIQYEGKDTFKTKIVEPILKDWASQHSFTERERRYSEGWKSVLRSTQERNVDTTFLNRPSKLFEGKSFRVNSNETDTFKINTTYKEIYTENLGFSYTEWEDSTTKYWIELIEQMPLKEFERQARHGLHRVAYIDQDETLDKNEPFELCEVNDRIYDYYNGGATNIYKGGKKAIWNIVNQYLDVEKLFVESGYLTFRFIVNCKGEAGRFITEEADLDYQPKTFNEATVTHFYEILKEMTGWIPTKLKEEDVDAYFYLTFKLKDGKLIEFLP